jgi:hypothetical protein
VNIVQITMFIANCCFYVVNVMDTHLLLLFIFTAIEYCDGRKCALKAKCVNFQCVCDDGYYGDAYCTCTCEYF